MRCLFHMFLTVLCVASLQRKWFMQNGGGERNLIMSCRALLNTFFFGVNCSRNLRCVSSYRMVLSGVWRLCNLSRFQSLIWLSSTHSFLYFCVFIAKTTKLNMPRWSSAAEDLAFCTCWFWSHSYLYERCQKFLRFSFFPPCRLHFMIRLLENFHHFLENLAFPSGFIQFEPWNIDSSADAILIFRLHLNCK